MGNVTKDPPSETVRLLKRVNQADNDRELETLRRSVQRSRPFGQPEWQKQIGKSDPVGYNTVETGGLNKVRAPVEHSCKRQFRAWRSRYE